jgi:hypothetical protein
MTIFGVEVFLMDASKLKQLKPLYILDGGREHKWYGNLHCSLSIRSTFINLYIHILCRTLTQICSIIILRSVLYEILMLQQRKNIIVGPAYIPHLTMHFNTPTYGIQAPVKLHTQIVSWISLLSPCWFSVRILCLHCSSFYFVNGNCTIMLCAFMLMSLRVHNKRQHMLNY